jgi:hypothetical protein
MIYEYEFGDASRAVAVSDEYLALCRQLHPQKLSEDLRISSYAHTLVGNFDVARDRLQEAVANARDQVNPSQEARSLEGIAQLQGNEGDFAGASVTVCQLREVFRRCPPTAQLTMHVTIAGIAAIVGDHELARQQLAMIDGVALTLHGRCDVLAAQVIATVSRGDQCSDELLRELIALNNRLEGRPGQQEPVAAIAMGLAQFGRTADALSVVNRYTKQTRKELWASRHPAILSVQRKAAASA